jgi:pilus assembly protein CpaE
VQDEATKAVVQEAFGHRNLQKSTTHVQLGGLASAVAYYGENSTPNVILVQASEGGDDLLGAIDSLAEVCDAGTNVVLMGGQNDVQLYRQLVRKGVGDYLVSPFAPKQIYESIAAICFDPSKPPEGRSVAFIAARGGAGSSTLAHNVAYSVGQLYKDDAILLDLDITFGTAGLAFNLEAPQGIHSALAEPDRLDAQLLDRFMAEYNEYLKLLVAPAQLDAQEKLYSEALDRLLSLVKLKAPFIVLDVPHRWAPWSQQLLFDADEVVVVSTLDLAGLRDSKNLIEKLKTKRGEDAPTRVVLNHVGAYKKTELAQKDFEEGLGRPVSLLIPHDPATFGQASINGQMVEEVAGKSKVAELIRQLSGMVSARDVAASRKKVGKGLQALLAGVKLPFLNRAKA